MPSHPPRCGRHRALAAIAALLLTSAVPAVADAAAPTLTSAGSDATGHVLVSWTLPAGSTAQTVEVARSPATISDPDSTANGSFAVCCAAGGVVQGQTSWNSSPAAIVSGRYYVMVSARCDDSAACDVTCRPGSSCPEEWSSIVPVHVQLPAPVLVAAGYGAGVFTASWSLPESQRSFIIEIASRPETQAVPSSIPGDDPMGDGAFLPANVVRQLGANGQSASVSTPLEPGTYYAHVLGLNVQSSGKEWSNTLPFTVTAAASASPQSPAPASSPRTTSVDAPGRTTAPSAIAGGIRLSVRCQTACAIASELRADRRAARRLGLPGGRSAVVGRATARLAEAGARPVVVYLTRAARRRLSHARLPLTLTVATKITEQRSARTFKRKLKIASPSGGARGGQRNRPPQFGSNVLAGPIVTHYEYDEHGNRTGSRVELTIYRDAARDPDGDQVTYNWSATLGTVSPTGGTVIGWTRSAVSGEIPSADLVVTAVDGRGGRASLTFKG